VLAEAEHVSARKMIHNTCIHLLALGQSVVEFQGVPEAWRSLDLLGSSKTQWPDSPSHGQDRVTTLLHFQPRQGRGETPITFKRNDRNLLQGLKQEGQRGHYTGASSQLRQKQVAALPCCCRRWQLRGRNASRQLSRPMKLDATAAAAAVLLCDSRIFVLFNLEKGV
jgi:hypothetical protein